MTPLVEQLIFGDKPPEGYKRKFEDCGVWYKPIGRGRWDLIKYPSCEIEPCGGCGRLFPPTVLYSGSLPSTRRPADWVEGVDYGKGAYRNVCRGCANRFDALHRRWRLYHEIARLIRRLEKEITNARNQARAA